MSYKDINEEGAAPILKHAQFLPILFVGQNLSFIYQPPRKPCSVSTPCYGNENSIIRVIKYVKA
jgi:hypothetical protein